jgi:cysteinyl-tRNA synthetase
MFSLFSSAKPVARDIYFTNSATRQKELFTPRKGNVVKMYSCGPTVYDNVQIGNLRAFLLSDIARRVLIRAGYQVEQTMNLTDFGHLSDDGDHGEDKMMRALAREDLPLSLENMRRVADTYISAFQDDLEAMRILPPDNLVRASDYIPAQIKLVKTLSDKGYTYETTDGVYFDVTRFERYGQLGNVDIDAIQAGARVEQNDEKHHPADFAVWKKGSLGWDSPWGKGFPGWHIECSAMAIATLGKSIDIHTGGEDLQYTHHNAEIAQCECATGKPFVNYWLHNAFVTIDGGTKIAKSKGNAVTLRQLHDHGFTGDDYRYWLMTSHYRSTVQFSWTALEAAKTALYRLKRYRYETYGNKLNVPDRTYLERFDTHLADDLDTCGAITTLWDLVKDDSVDNATKAGTMVAMDEILDIGLSDRPADALRTLGVVASDEVPSEINELIEARETARLARDYAAADMLRSQIESAGYTVEDSAHGPKVIKR